MEALFLYFRMSLHRTVWCFVTSDRVVTFRACDYLSTEKIIRTVLLGYSAN